MSTLDNPADAIDAGAQDEDPTLVEDMRLLAAEVRHFAEAELAYQRARATYAGQSTGTIAVLGIVAATMAFFAAMAAIIGTLVALAARMSPWAAMGLVTVVLLLLALVCATAALSKARAMKAVLSQGNGDGERG